MHQIPLLQELLIVACFGVVVTMVLARFRLPMVAGLLLAGALVGPYGFKLVRDIRSISVLSELGVGLLLFSIGLEFSLKRLIRVMKVAAIGGFLQVGLTVLGVVAVAFFLGESFSRGILFGFIIALSSTAIVMSFLSSRGELDAPHGRFIVGILIFQDLCVVPMLLVVPALAKPGSHHLIWELSKALGTAVIVVVVTVMAARIVIPRIFKWVDATRMREIFLLAVLAVCLGIAWITSRYGLSVTLGAFLAGLVLADSDFGDRALADVFPLRSTFTSIFFISLGMLVDFRLVVEKPLAVTLLLVSFFFGKGLIGALAALAMKFPSRIAWLSGVGIAQFGEFGFVLAKLGEKVGLMGHNELSLIISAGVFSMFLTPILMLLAPHVTAGEKILQPLERLLGVRGIDEPTSEHEKLAGHVVIAGFGVAGKLLAQTLVKVQIPYLVLELNADKVQSARAEGEPIYYGDITSPEAMAHARVNHARAIVLLISDPQAARRAITSVQTHAPNTPVFLRSRFYTDRKELFELGADHIVTEELESAIQMIFRVMRFCNIPATTIQPEMTRLRLETDTDPHVPHS